MERTPFVETSHYISVSSPASTRSGMPTEANAEHWEVEDFAGPTRFHRIPFYRWSDDRFAWSPGWSSVE